MGYKNYKVFMIVNTPENTEESLELDVKTKHSRDSKVKKFVAEKLNIPLSSIILFKTFKVRQ